uniref:(northern house mosquito) hypothetical protein n=1 Tax=Culex pipiens TaxID=7175 RepID=A0A8D8AXC2_CULPI
MAIPGTVDLAIDDGARTGCPAVRRTELSGARNFTARHSLTRLELLHRLLVVGWRETHPQLPESFARIAADQRTWHVVGGVENCCVPSLAKWSDLHCSSTVQVAMALAHCYRAKRFVDCNFTLALIRCYPARRTKMYNTRSNKTSS